MPDDQHPGFEYWQLNEPGGFAFPVGNINLSWGDNDGASASVEFDVPQALPHDKTVAERSVGVAKSAKLWFALRCETDLQGKVHCKAVLRGRHLHWFAEHGESAPGGRAQVVLSAADLKGGGFRQDIVDHAPNHCDVLSVTWGQTQAGKVICNSTLLHFGFSPAQFLEWQEQVKRDRQRGGLYWEAPKLPSPEPPPVPTPAPAPDPGPDPD